VDAVKYAYELVPDVKAVTATKQSVLHAALAPGPPPTAAPADLIGVIQFLADHGAELDLADASGRTPWHLAEGRNKPAAELLGKLIRATGAEPKPRPNRE
jgi:ankyrin repeat protein